MFLGSTHTKQCQACFEFNKGVLMYVISLWYRYQPDGPCTDLRKFIDGPSHYLTLPPDLKAAVDAINYIAEQLQAEKDYEAVSDLE